MKLNIAMQELLNELCVIEPARQLERLNVIDEELGNRMIDLYYRTTNLRSREVIKSFLSEAGFVWLRKLITRDMQPIDSYYGIVASVEEYVSAMAANDDYLKGRLVH